MFRKCPTKNQLGNIAIEFLFSMITAVADGKTDGFGLARSVPTPIRPPLTELDEVGRAAQAGGGTRTRKLARCEPAFDFARQGCREARQSIGQLARKGHERAIGWL